VFGFLWFVMLFLAAITSSLAMLQPVIAFLEEGLGMRRHTSVACLSSLSIVGSGFVVYFSRKQVALDTYDFWAGTMLLLVLATVQSLLYGWVLGIDRGEREAHEGAHLRIPRFVQYVLKFVSPLFLIAILIGSVVGDWGELSRAMKAGGLIECLKLVAARTQNAITSSVGAGLSIGFMLALVVLFAALIFVAGRRWQAEGRFKQAIKGRQP